MNGSRALTAPWVLRAAAGLVVVLGSAPPVAFARTTAVTAAELPELKRFEFRALESRVLPGNSTESVRGCRGRMDAGDQLGDLAIVSTFYQNNCYTGGTYSHADFRVEQGEFTGGWKAYRLHEPSRKATKFLASHHVVFYRFPTAVDHVAYLFDGTSLFKRADIPKSRITPGAFVKIGEVDVSALGGSTVLLMVPAGARLSAFAELGPGVEGARLGRTAVGTVDRYRLRVNGTPFDTRLGYTAGPASHSNIYGRTKTYFPVVDAQGSPGVVWQDQKSLAVFVTWVGVPSRPQTVELPQSTRQPLAAATADGRGNLYYLTVEERAASLTARRVLLSRSDATGRNPTHSSLDAGPSGLNMVAFGTSNVASLAVSGDRLGLVIGRTMHKSGDGLNHQGAIAVVLDARTLRVVRNLGQTSGHSFDNDVNVDASGDFLALDLGDNYPRGVHLHRFHERSRSSRLVFTFKTLHGRQARSPAGRTYPLYDEISRAGKQFYRWSNDNATYTELGGVVAGERGYTVVFAGEFSPAGRALDSARTGETANDSRNIGLVLVRPDFPTGPRWGSEIPDEAMLTRGPSEVGGFYDFGGRWTKQRNAGVVQLTRYRDPKTENVSRLKVVGRPGGRLLLLWEKWGSAYSDTQAMQVTDDGRILAGPTSLGSLVRLGRTDECLSRPEGAYCFSGDQADSRVELTIIRDTP